MCYENLEDTWNDTIGKYDPLTARIAEKVMETDSKMVEGVARKWGLDGIGDEAQHNQDHPAQGIGKASTVYASFAAPGWFGGMAGSPAAYEAAVPAVGAEQAALLAAQTGEFGAYGLGQTMSAAGSANGLTAAQQAAARGGGLMGKLAGGSGGTAQKMGMQLMQNNMGQQQRPPMQAPPPRPSSTQMEPLPKMYGQNSMDRPMPGETWEQFMRRKQQQGMR